MTDSEKRDVMTSFVYDEHSFQNSTAFANDFQSEAPPLSTLRFLQLTNTFEVSQKALYKLLPYLTVSYNGIKPFLYTMDTPNGYATI